MLQPENGKEICGMRFYGYDMLVAHERIAALVTQARPT